jgi:hypothetical protein
VDVEWQIPSVPGGEVPYAVVESALPALVEAQHDVGVIRGRIPEAGRDRFRAHCGLHHPAFQEVSGEGGFGEDDEVVDPGRVAYALARAGQVFLDPRLAGFELDEPYPEARATVDLQAFSPRAGVVPPAALSGLWQLKLKIVSRRGNAVCMAG